MKNRLLVRTKISPVFCEKFLCEKEVELSFDDDDDDDDDDDKNVLPQYRNPYDRRVNNNARYHIWFDMNIFANFDSATVCITGIDLKFHTAVPLKKKR